jgi:hypothetical protein
MLKLFQLRTAFADVVICNVWPVWVVWAEPETTVKPWGLAKQHTSLQTQYMRAKTTNESGGKPQPEQLRDAPHAVLHSKTLARSLSADRGRTAFFIRVGAPRRGARSGKNTPPTARRRHNTKDARFAG